MAQRLPARARRSVHSWEGSRSSIVFIRPLGVNNHHFLLLFQSRVTYSGTFIIFAVIDKPRSQRGYFLLGPSVRGVLAHAAGHRRAATR